MPGGSAKDRERKTRLWICDGITVECGPASIMVGDDVDHEVQREGRLELGIAERSRKLTRQRGMVVHHNRAIWAARGCRLNEHGASTLKIMQSSVWG